MKTHNPRMGQRSRGVLAGAVGRLIGAESKSLKLTDREMADAVNRARERGILDLPREVKWFDVARTRGRLGEQGLIPKKRRPGNPRGKEGRGHKKGAETLVRFSRTHDIDPSEMTTAMRDAFPDASSRSLDTTLFSARKGLGMLQLRSRSHSRERE